MKMFAVGLFVLALLATMPATSHAQVRVQLNVGFNRYAGHDYGYSRWHPVNRYYAYHRYGSYPARIVIVRRHFRPAPVVVVRSRYRHSYRHW